MLNNDRIGIRTGGETCIPVGATIARPDRFLYQLHRSYLPSTEFLRKNIGSSTKVLKLSIF